MSARVTSITLHFADGMSANLTPRSGTRGGEDMQEIILDAKANDANLAWTLDVRVTSPDDGGAV